MHSRRRHTGQTRSGNRMPEQHSLVQHLLQHGTRHVPSCLVKVAQLTIPLAPCPLRRITRHFLDVLYLFKVSTAPAKPFLWRCRLDGRRNQRRPGWPQALRRRPHKLLTSTASSYFPPSCVRGLSTISTAAAVSQFLQGPPTFKLRNNFDALLGLPCMFSFHVFRVPDGTLSRLALGSAPGSLPC